ncbi:GNAT family N-acetyltransferase [Embleya scabrispora]|uniref:GNAT family N-acetyltransferase n=1 Tax=Embleya scabrispora TaxID=159449 RepID=UPI000360B376|nr:GNAT family N-acetyltransferase [Embleya scabrispora]MYS81736.1 GNAT family N-acetyltransferase [Streptomyces sp. SID5474]
MDIRTIGEDDIIPWTDAVGIGFLRVPDDAKETREKRIEHWRERADFARTRGAFDGGRCVGTFRSFATGLTVPGGAMVPVSAITNVTVSPTHRRQGLLTELMGLDLADAAARGESLAILIAAEYRIYGRFGFGVATEYQKFTLDTLRTDFVPDAPVEPGARIALATPEEVVELGPPLHEEFRRLRAGAIARTALWWKMYTGLVQPPMGGPTPPRFHAVYRDPSGKVAGLVSYRTDDHWDEFVPKVTLTVDSLLALTPAAEIALWRFCANVDYVNRVEGPDRSPDELLPLLVQDPRAITTQSRRDFVWARILDAPAAFSARTYGARDRLVVEVHDDLGYAAGRFAIDGAAEQARCVPTGDPADLALDVSTLGALYLGAGSPVRLAVAGRISERTPGAAERAEALLRTAREPWCPDWF